MNVANAPSPTPIEGAARRVLDAVAARPGADTATVARALGLDHSTASYHLRRLARRGRVATVAVGRYRAHYASGCGLCPLVRRALPLLGDGAAARAALEALRAAGARGVRASDVARASGAEGADLGAIRWALSQSVAAGIADVVGYGRFALSEGADACAERVLARGACPKWSACEPGARWRAREPGPPT